MDCVPPGKRLFRAVLVDSVATRIALTDEGIIRVSHHVEEVRRFLEAYRSGDPLCSAAQIRVDLVSGSTRPSDDAPRPPPEKRALGVREYG